MTQRLWVPGPLPGWREVIAAATSGHGKGNGYARLKKEWTEVERWLQKIYNQTAFGV